MSPQKRKRVSVTIQQKLDILQKLEDGVKISKIAAEYNLGWSTVHDIKKNKEKLLQFSSSMATSVVGIDQRHTMKVSPYAILDKAVLHWFNQERRLGNPVSGPMIAQRAKELFVTLGLEGTFDASSGWLFRFKDRFGIRQIGNSMDCIWTRKDLLTDLHEEAEEPTNIQEDYESKQFLDNVVSHDPSTEAERESDNEMLLRNTTYLVKDHNYDNDSSSNNDALSKLRKRYASNAAKDKISEMTLEEDEENSCVCHKLKTVAEKLQSISDKINADLLCDSYDDFTKYISSLLRGLPKVKALNLKKKVVNDIIEALLEHEQESTMAKTSLKRNVSKNLLKNHSTKFGSGNKNSSTTTSSLQNSPTSSIYSSTFVHSSDIPTSATVTQCESIRTVTSTADGTLVAVTLPSRASFLAPDPPPSHTTKRNKRKQDSHRRKSLLKRKATASQIAVVNTLGLESEDRPECSVLKETGSEAEIDIEEGKELADMKSDGELMDVHFTMVTVKEEEVENPTVEENEDVAQLHLCDLCLSHCPTREELIQHFLEEHSGCVPNYKDMEDNR